MNETLKIFTKIMFISLPTVAFSGFAVYWFNGFLIENGIQVPQWLYGTTVTVVILIATSLIIRKPLAQLEALDKAEKDSREAVGSPGSLGQATRFALQLISGAVAAISLSVLALLLIPDPFTALAAAFSNGTTSLRPGAAGYMFAQLVVTLFAAGCTSYCVTKERQQIYVELATAVNVLAMVLAALDVYWLSAFVGIQSVAFIWYMRAKGHG